MTLHSVGVVAYRAGALACAAAGVAVASAVPATAVTPAFECEGLAATLIGTSGRDVLRGTPGDDVIVALGGTDRVNGRQGDDVVCGGLGADLLNGGRGDDRLFGGLDFRWYSDGWWISGDELHGGRGADHLDAGHDPRRGVRNNADTLSWRSAIGGVRLDLQDGTAVGQGRDSIVSGPDVQYLLTDQDDEVRGSEGTDRVETFSGADSVHLGAGSDVVGLDGENDTSHDTAWGGKGADYLSGGRDLVGDEGSGGENALHGGAGDDFLIDRGGGDVLSGGPDNDTLWQDALEFTSGLDVDGGAGVDHWIFNVADAHEEDVGRAEIDLAAGTFVYMPEGGPVTSLSVPGFEKVKAGLPWFVNVALYGTDGHNRLEADGNSLSIHGRGGNDYLFTRSNNFFLDGGDGHDEVPPWVTCTEATCASIEGTRS